MANRPRDEMVPRHGLFIGSSGLLFVEQTAADVYFENYFHTAPNQLNDRIAIVCTSWGMSMLYIQRGRRNQGLDAQWRPRATLNGLVQVHDHGIQPPNGNNNVPLAIRIVQAGSPGVHHVNDVLVTGARIPWHRRIIVSRSDGEPLHYHQHEKRRGHIEEEVPAVKVDGGHATFRALVYGSQVSNYRRAQRDL